MHWVCPCTVSWLKNSPQSMHDSCGHATKTSINHRGAKDRSRKEPEQGKGVGRRSDLVRGAAAEVAGELGLLEVLATVLALEPHHR